ncbi:hypothetical protein [Ruminococcus sp.]|uniref:hypothetical protein n=1 Tax=Ruminococcus sp. TaxID=41978 RepID=UPI001B5CEDEF|nr:hypothetical protein [Ruminococcus sp.]MBP5433197.1 hypothetical protein [Ruminococcus sp.]
MKKKGYKVINSPLDGYDFSFTKCHAAEVGAYGIGFIIFILLCTLLVCTVEDDNGWSGLYENIYIPVVSSIPLLILGLSMTFRIRRVKKIITNGKKTDGEVISYRRIHVTHGKKSRLINQPNYTILNVRFHDNGNHECAVGVGRKLPEKVLASPYCTVYIFNDKVFVAGFNLRKNGAPQIAFELKE